MKLWMSTRLFGLMSAVLFATGALALWTVSSDTRASASLPAAATYTPAPAVAEEIPILAPPPAPPARSREEQRFARADRDDDGLISQTEYLAARRRNYDKLDSNGDGKLSFEEYAASGIQKFATADADGNGSLAAPEYATTAPKPKKPAQLASHCKCDGVLAASEAQ